MKVLLVKPNEYATEIEMENNLKAMQKAVGGHIEVFQPNNNDPVIYVLNEEGKMMELDANRALYDKHGNVFDVIVGTFFVCGVKGDDFTSLSPVMMDKYKQQFYEPEVFTRLNGKIFVVKTDGIDAKKPIAEQLREGADQAQKDNAARPAPTNDNKDKGDRT